MAQAVESETRVVQYEPGDGFVTLWLNRPEKRNCFNWEQITQFDECVKRAEADDAVRAIVVRGRGNTFCSGADLDMLDGDYLTTSSASLDMAWYCSEMYDRLAAGKKPTIAVVEGYATAGGFELMISTDFALAADDAKMGDFHIRRGVFGGCGPIYRLPRMLGMRKAKELMLTGKLLSGVEAAQWGLVNASAPSEQLDQLVHDFLAPLLDKSPFTMWITKQTVNVGLDADTHTLRVLENLACNVVHQSQDAKEGVRAFLEKRPAVWSGR